MLYTSGNAEAFYQIEICGETVFHCFSANVHGFGSIFVVFTFYFRSLFYPRTRLHPVSTFSILAILTSEEGSSQKIDSSTSSQT